MIQGKTLHTKKSTKHSIREASKPQQLGAPRAAGGIHHDPWKGWHSRASWDARLCVSAVPVLLRVCGFLRGLSFSCAFFQLLPFKNDVHGQEKDRIPPHPIHHSPSSLVLA